MDHFKESIVETTHLLGLADPSVVEKDFHVTRALHALCGVNNKYFKLIFQGGTCLSKALKLLSACQKIVTLE